MHAAAHAPAPEPDQAPSLAYVQGVLRYDFVSEARRDSLSAEMRRGGRTADAANPKEFLAYLKENPQRAESVIWLLCQEAMPLYALQPAGAYAHLVYEQLRRAGAELLRRELP